MATTLTRQLDFTKLWTRFEKVALRLLSNEAFELRSGVDYQTFVSLNYQLGRSRGICRRDIYRSFSLKSENAVRLHDSLKGLFTQHCRSTLQVRF